MGLRGDARIIDISSTNKYYILIYDPGHRRKLKEFVDQGEEFDLEQEGFD